MIESVLNQFLIKMIQHMFKLSYFMSTLAVASSSTRIGFFLSRALAKQKSCLCPTLKLLPPSLMIDSKPSSIVLQLQTSVEPEKKIRKTSWKLKKYTIEASVSPGLWNRVLVSGF